MRRFGAFLTAGVCGLVMTGAARAADMPGSWLPDLKKQVFTDLISGWYARGDLGYRQQRIGSVETPAPLFATQWDLQSVATFGVGGGYKYKWFRSDVTFDYGSTGRFTADTAVAAGYYSAKLDSFTLLANVYLDLGEWGGFTPYIGAGVGTSNIRVHQYTNASIVEPNDGVVDTSRWSLSWAVMGGVSYRFSPTLLLDVSYRYLKLGEAQSGPEPIAYTTRTFFRDISANEVRVGLRWMLD
jgi:opacity protein-like surface antigen